MTAMLVAVMVLLGRSYGCCRSNYLLPRKLISTFVTAAASIRLEIVFTLMKGARVLSVL
jgi:hypothetical protein